MSPELIYFIKINGALMLFYAFYRLLFYKDTFFNLRRSLLITFFILAIVYPLMNFQEWVQQHEPIVEVIQVYSSIIAEPNYKTEAGLVNDWPIIIQKSFWGIYWIGVLLLMIRFFSQLWSILWLKWTCKKSIIHNTPIYLLNKPAGPFSFFQMIFIYLSAHSKEELMEITTHESTHVRQWHSIDVVLSECMCIFCWMNPFIWLLKREVRHNLEYLADDRVLESGYDSKSYQYHLLGLTHHSSTTNLYNSFNVLHLKNRIHMMNKKRSSSIERTKYLMVIPLCTLLMLVSNIETLARVTKDITQQIIPSIENRQAGAGLLANSSLESSIEEYLLVKRQTLLLSSVTSEMSLIQKEAIESSNVFTVVEEMPLFPGGDNELLKYVQRAVKYPEYALENRIEGRVVCSFTVNTDGKLVDLEIVRGVDPSLDREALRVIGAMPKWYPGKQKGKPVRVKYTMPIAFRLA